MSKRLKMLPAFVMLLAAALTSIITYCVRYETKTALLILLGVMILFYILGTVLQRVIASFEKANQPKPEEKSDEQKPEGTVLEKDAGQETENASSEDEENGKKE